MNKVPTVRTMLVGADKKYIKAINEVGLVDYLKSITTNDDNRQNTVFDFHVIVENFHAVIDKKFAYVQFKELQVNRHTVFNSWTRFRTMTNQGQKGIMAISLAVDTERVMNSILFALPGLEAAYLSAKEYTDGFPQSYPKTEAFESYTLYLDCYVEALLCSFHTTVTTDLKSFKDDVILTGHAHNIRNSIISCLDAETDYRNKQFQQRSLIYQCCMENMGLDTAALLSLMVSNVTIQDLKNIIYDNFTLTTETDRYFPYRKMVHEWPAADPRALDRTKKLASLLQNINSLIYKMEELKAGDFDFDNTIHANEKFANQIALLLSK
ncbi:hypothetical protein [Pseudomonas sp. dw_612]|uniref:hypothetical protein n=1 Tax=Pseudomonas sp. dw_612 TaxID=2720080 RepID=UPI001BD37203|nr:hypothetical protein [Pseudomonas sp. dw_612]